MSESDSEHGSEKDSEHSDQSSEGITDDQLPEDLQPSEDNPLAEPLSEEEAPDDPNELDMFGSSTDDSRDDSTDDSTDDSADDTSDD